ncbi:MAG: glycosyltransferase family 4 protein [Verrucomicrobiota bacterium]|nr:glycosyltransferase family 4 protein [Verrucomicrobiota bacterium]
MARVLRIAYVFERFPSFGQTFLYREVAELVRQGAEVTIFSIRKPTGEPSQDWDENLVKTVHYLPDEAELVREISRAMRGRELPPAAVRAITEWDRQSDFLRLYQAAYIGLRLPKAGITRVHAHFAGMAARTAYWLKQFFGIAYSVTAHANDIFAPRNFVVSLGKIFDAATAIVTVSDFSAAQLRERFPANRAKLHRVYNGIDVAAFAPSELSSEPPLIVSVGRLIEKKGFAELIRACAILKQRGRDFRCEVIGEGPLQQELAAQITDAGLDERVQLVGPLSQLEIADRLRVANVFVLACTTDADGGMDNLPTVIMEAMAACLPVVSTPIAGVPEMVEPGLTGELVPPRDATALAGGIAQLLADRQTAGQFGRAGRARAAERFSIEANVRALATLLQQP